MWIFCSGMFRSGSTVQYQVASHVVERSGRGTRVTWHSPDAFDAVRREHSAAGRLLVFKAHGLTPAMRDEVEAHGARVITVHRDVRDVVVSAMRKNGWTFPRIWREGRLDRWTRRFDEWAALPGALVSRYDDLVADLPGEVVRIAAHLGCPVAAGDAAGIGAAYGIERQRERTEAVRQRRVDGAAAAKFDPHSLLHHNHIASGASGEFRRVLRPEQIRAIEDECGAWLAKWGYAADRPALSLGQRLLRLQYRRAA